MLKKKEVLIEEFRKFQEVHENIYVGEACDVMMGSFDTDNLYIAHLVHFVGNPNSADANFKKSDFKYILEKFKYADSVFYREIFSGAVLERIDLKKVLSSRGMYVFEPVSYDDYMAVISSLSKNKDEENACALRRVKVKA